MTNVNYTLSFVFLSRTKYFYLALFVIFFLVGCGGGSSSSGSNTKLPMPDNYVDPINQAVNRILAHPVYSEIYRRYIRGVVFGGQNNNYGTRDGKGNVVLFASIGQDYSGADLYNTIGTTIVHELSHAAVGSGHCHDDAFMNYLLQALAELGYTNHMWDRGVCKTY